MTMLSKVLRTLQMSQRPQELALVVPTTFDPFFPIKKHITLPLRPIVLQGYCHSQIFENSLRDITAPFSSIRVDS
jgi:hypothetical protein